MSGFYTDVHGLTLPGSTDVLRLRMLGVPKSKVGEYTSATAEEYANYVVDEVRSDEDRRTEGWSEAKAAYRPTL